jgi:hypothetical protein
VESQAAIDLGSFAVHPGQGPWAIIVDWGDNATDTSMVDHAAGIGGLAHAYHLPGTYGLTISSTDRLGLIGSGGFMVKFTAQPPRAPRGRTWCWPMTVRRSRQLPSRQWSPEEARARPRRRRLRPRDRPHRTPPDDHAEIGG